MNIIFSINQKMHLLMQSRNNVVLESTMPQSLLLCSFEKREELAENVPNDQVHVGIRTLI